MAAAVVAARITPAMMNAASAAWLALLGVGGMSRLKNRVPSTAMPRVAPSCWTALSSPAADPIS